MIPAMVFPSHTLEGALDEHATTSAQIETAGADHRARRRAQARASPLDSACRALPRPADDGPGRDHRQRRAAVDPARTALHAGQPHVGDRRLPDHLRRLPAAGRQVRRPGRPQEGVPQRARPVRGGLDPVRPGGQPGDADRRPPAPGGRRRGRLERDPRDHRHRVPGEGRAGQGDGHVRVRLRRRRLDRPARRRRAHAVAELALDLLRQRADRRGRPAPRLRC